MARLRATLRDRATMGVEQKRPMLTPGVAELALSAATARSQVATSWHPAAVAVPCTAAITGFGQATIACIRWRRCAWPREERAPGVGVGAVRGELLQIVAGAEGRPVGGEHDGRDGGVGAER